MKIIYCTNGTKHEIGSLEQISSIYWIAKGSILKTWKNHCKQNVAFLFPNLMFIIFCTYITQVQPTSDYAKL